MPTKLEKAESSLEGFKKRAREEKKEARMRGEGLVVTLGTAWGMGYVEKKKIQLPKVKGVDQKLQYGAGAIALSFFTKNKKTKRYLGNAGETLLGIVAYEVGKKGASELTIEGSNMQQAADAADEEADEEVVETGAM